MEAGRRLTQALGSSLHLRLLDVVSESFVSGVSSAFEVISAIAVGGLIVSLLFVGGSLIGGRSGSAAEAGG